MFDNMCDTDIYSVNIATKSVSDDENYIPGTQMGIHETKENPALLALQGSLDKTLNPEPLFLFR